MNAFILFLALAYVTAAVVITELEMRVPVRERNKPYRTRVMIALQKGRRR